MRKISSKIIISLILAIFLFGGVGFGVGENVNTNILVAQAFDENAAKEACGGNSALSANPEAFKACLVNEMSKERDRPAAAGSSWWEDMLKAGGTMITDSLGRIVMMVNGFLLQAIAIPLMSMLFRISAALLNMATSFTLSSELFNNSGISSGIVTIWSLIRDICNITFIFILLWSAIQMIIGIAGANAKKMVANVIIAALLINFSLFITRIVIDAGNILGVTLYNSIRAIDPTVGFDSLIMQQLGLAGLSNIKEAAGASIIGVFSISFGIISYLQLIVIFVAFIVFIYAMLLMATRTVILIFLMAISPIGFMGDVLPKLSEYSKQWRETLYGQVMIAPTFLLFVYLILKIGSSFDFEKMQKLAGVAKENMAYVTYFKYVMMILLLIIAVKVTKKMTGPIGAAVEKFGMAAAGIGIGAVTGGLAFAGRRVIGGGAAKLASSQELKDAAANGSMSAKAKLWAYNKTAASSFDARNTSGFKSAVGLSGVKIPDKGLLIPSINKGGYTQTTKDAEKKAEEYAKWLGKVDKTTDEEKSARKTQIQKDIKITEQSLNEANLNLPLNASEEEVANRLKTIKELEKKKKEQQDLLDDDKKLSDKIEKDKKDARLKRAAETEEKSIINKFTGTAKAKSEKIRAAMKEKTSDETLNELVKKRKEEEEAKSSKKEAVVEEKPKEKTAEPSEPKTK